MIGGLWDAYQQVQIHSLNSQAKHRKDEATRLEDRMRYDLGRLESKIDGLALVTQALWELLRRHTDLTDADILARMAEIDLRDGRKDGRISGVPVDCPSCKRPAHTRQRACMYCGTPIDGQHITESY